MSEVTICGFTVESLAKAANSCQGASNPQRSHQFQTERIYAPQQFGAALCMAQEYPSATLTAIDLLTFSLH
ncbi:MAG TPA: hypothetical protein V6D14_20900 [Coleofasciculaceae cyanobacterium]